ncbi:hypothetical protein EX30DRAFT_398375 [Ascodesmis nigricans]|uniref:Helicase SWR1 n=1 Tax=Ascodesmis nigricans TaxID=341454 RepID=A0A4S2MRH2_9PEZI|nr:hypothetical protein EX30DRAFT_398375 [Ascodesmis nigricans]
MGNARRASADGASDEPDAPGASFLSRDGDGDVGVENGVGTPEPSGNKTQLPSTAEAADEPATTTTPAVAEPSSSTTTATITTATTTPSTTKRPRKRKHDDSPPWKSATTQTPTVIYTDDGRRRSGRTNLAHTEVMKPPPVANTPTRPARGASAKQQKDGGTARSTASRSRSQSTSQSQPNKRAKTTAQPSPSSRTSNRIAKTATPSSARGAAKSPQSKKSTSRQTANPTRQRGASKSTPSKPPPKSRRSPAVGTRKSARALQKALAAAKEELESGNYDDLDSESGFSTDGEVEVDPNVRLPRVKLRFGVPKPVITHPLQLLPPKEYETFEDFLYADDPTRTEEGLQRAEEEAQAEAEVRNRIEYEARHGLLTIENCSLFMPDKQPEPPRQYGHHDHLVCHALKFQKLMMKEKREHQDLMRKRNAAVMAEIRERQPRTQEEIEQEQYAINWKLYKDQISQLTRKWQEVTKEVERRRKERAEEERRQAGKQHLHQMLEHSTQLLDARRADRPESVVSVSEMDLDEEILDDEEEFDEALEDDLEQELGDDANMSDSESDPDPDPDDEDANLTVEQLRAKYSSITNTEADTPAMGDDDDDPGTDVDMDDERSDVGSDTPVPELEEVDPALLDDSDESIDMDSDMGSEGMSSEGEDDESDDGDTGLLGFYGGFAGLSAKKAQPRSVEGDQTLLREDEEEDDLDVVDLVGVPKASAPESSQPASPEKSTDVQEEEQESAAIPPPSGVGEESVGESIEIDPVTVPVESVAETSEPAVLNDPEPRQEEEDVNMLERPPSPPRIVELEDDGVTPKKPDDAQPAPENQESVDGDTATSVSQADAKDTGAQSSPTTSPEATPQPHHEISTPIPFLLRGTLREYQHYGLDWLAGLYENNTNGILADEMGLGKTIQTIALIAHLACEKGIWGPHLIVVPTSVMLNWEMEFKKWAPGFKILTYYGNREQRAEKRKGWFDTNLWHVCITSYQLVLQDQVTFKRRNWHYLILDEAHNIKNFRSQRWQTLLNFKSEARLLLTGTPLQNNLIELWSLLYFLMPAGTTSLPAGFANLQEFQEWFAHPVDQLIEGGREGMDDEAKRTVTKLHKVLRPYLLRRLKADVEKQMPAKYEHVVYCRLSKRQRYLYDDFMSMAKTRETLASGNYLSIINCLMQLRKVCNHPDLFETRQIVTSFAMQKSVVADYEIKELLVRKRLINSDLTDPSFGTNLLEFVGLVPAKNNHLTSYHASSISKLSASEFLRQYYNEKAAALEPAPKDLITIQGNIRYQKYQADLEHLGRLNSRIRLNEILTHHKPLCPADLVEVCTRDISVGPLKPPPRNRSQTTEWFLNHSSAISSMIPTLSERAASLETTIIKFGCITPVVVATDMPEIALTSTGVDLVRRVQQRFPSDPFHESRIRLSIAFPDKRLLQYDCGKLQRLDHLLRELQAGGHRALIFTQMTKVLDILEQFLNIHGHRYLRLDGATKVEQRQALTDRFNNDPKIPVFILSTRSGGLGINLTGADTVIFYDLDWNPAMDKQCQDRCHRIGQTRDVHIYRFVSEYTIESNILRKSEQKRMLDDVIIQEGDFTTDYFHKLSIADMLGEDVVRELHVEDQSTHQPIVPGTSQREIEKTLEQVEDIEDAAAAKVAQKEVVDTDVADFEEQQIRERERHRRKSSLSAATAAAAAAAESAPASNAATPIPSVADTPMPMEVDDVVQEDTAETNVNKGLGHDVYGEGWGRVDREPQHIDDYMIRQMEWELMDVPVVLKDTRDKRKRNKKGKKF